MLTPRRRSDWLAPTPDRVRKTCTDIESGLLRHLLRRGHRSLALPAHQAPPRRLPPANALAIRNPSPTTFRATRSVCSLSQRSLSLANSSWSSFGSISSTRLLIGTLPTLVETSIPTRHAAPRSVLLRPADLRESSTARTLEATVEPIQTGIIAAYRRVISCSALMRSSGPSFPSEG